MKRTRKYYALIAAITSGIAFMPQAHAADTAYDTDTVQVEAEGVDNYLVTTNTITAQEIADRGYRARAIAYVPQAHTPPFPFTVRDVVVMGRDGKFSIGRTDDVMTEKNLENLYGVTAKIVGYEGIPESRTYVPIPPVS